MTRAVIFDIDGTLINSAGAVFTSLRRLAREDLGRELSEDKLRQYLGWPTVRTLQDMGFADIATAQRRWNELYAAARDMRAPFPGIAELLEQLRGMGIRLGAVTAMERSEYDRDFVPLGLDRWMAASVCADETLHPKPAPDPLRKILGLLDAAAEQALYVGDNAADWQCARAAGVPFALVRYGPVRDGSLDADLYLDAPAQVLDWVRARAGR